MKSDQFKAWLIERNRLTSRPIADALSRCKRIEKIPEMDLDAEFARDGGKMLRECGLRFCK